MGPRKIIPTHGAVLCRLCSLLNFVRKILAGLPFFRIVLSSWSGAPLEFPSKAILTRVEAGSDPVLGSGLKFMRAKNIALAFALLLVPIADCAPDRSFDLMETSIADIHKAMQAGTLTCHNLVQQYLDRIHAY